jgi:hypothetical protein
VFGTYRAIGYSSTQAGTSASIVTVSHAPCYAACTFFISETLYRNKLSHYIEASMASPRLTLSTRCALPTWSPPSTAAYTRENVHTENLFCQEGKGSLRSRRDSSDCPHLPICLRITALLRQGLLGHTFLSGLVKYFSPWCGGRH